MLRKLVRARSWRVFAFDESLLEFFFWKRNPSWNGFGSNFIKDFFVYLMVESRIESSVESFPKTFSSNTQIIFIFDSFSCRKFALVNPIHQFPWTTTLVRNFSDFRIEKWPFGILYNFLESLLAFQASWCSIFVNGLFTLIVPLLFEVSCNSR